MPKRQLNLHLLELLLNAGPKAGLPHDVRPLLVHDAKPPALEPKLLLKKGEGVLGDLADRAIFSKLVA